MAHAQVPSVKLTNGQNVPIFGLGTYKCTSGEGAQAVRDAVDTGYRHFDCASFYENEKEVGGALREKIAEGVVKREDLYIVTKLWNTCHRPELVEPSLRTSLKNLGLDYVDLYLIHWPMAFQEGDELMPDDGNGKILGEDIDYVDTWQAMEQLVEKGLSRAIGVSNFNSEQLARLLSVAKIKPVMNQVECHLHLKQEKLLQLCTSKGIALTAYSPLGSPYVKPAEGTFPLLDDPELKTLSEKHGKTTAQIALRYLVQRGIIVIPKSIKKSRIQENFDIFDFELTSQEMHHLNSLGIKSRVHVFDQAIENKHYPFHLEF